MTNASICVVLFGCVVGRGVQAQYAVTRGGDSLPITLAVSASGFVLGQITEPVDPFYHASALLHTVVTARLGSHVELPVRVLAEVWNFSHQYGEGTVAVRPALGLRIPGLRPVDSLSIRAGDLWRVKHGQGLVVDYFESQGAEVTAHARHWSLQLRAIGFGWGAADDLYSASLSIGSLIGLRYLDDSPDVSLYRGSQLVSVDVAPTLAGVGDLYAEVGTNLDTRTWGALVGFRRRQEWGRGRSYVAVGLEVRHYDAAFFNNRVTGSYVNGLLVYPYYSSLTALDKPLNTFHLYLQRRGQHNVITGRVTGHVGLGDWFVDADVEGIGGTVRQLVYEASIGFAASPLADVRLGALNKLFQFPAYAQPMFQARDRPWPFIRATFGF